MAVVLVTGCSSGIGLATAIHFARLGHDVHAGVRNPASATELAAASGPKLRAITLDVNDDDSVRRGVEYLVSTQKADGLWDESEYTGTGFPKVYYLEYTNYRNYFSLQALGNYRTALAEGRAKA